MKTILNNNTDPRYNLALEEYVLKHLNTEEDIILLWQNEPSVIIGRNQNTIEEINSNYIKDHDIHVVRRISGGGAVYHDFGNLNYTFVTNNLKDNLNNYRKFTEPVIKALNELGVPAEFSGRNDIVVEGKKFSGNAQSFHRNRMYHHGTILYDANLEMVSKVLQVHLDKIESKGIKSNRSRVTNILPYMRNPLSVQDFKDHLLKYFLNTDDVLSSVIELTPADFKNIERIMKEKYMTWEWNYGESPEFDVVKSRRYAGGKIEFYFNVKDGVIENTKIYGDFLGKRDISEIEQRLIGTTYKEESIRSMFEELPLEEFFYNITLDDLIDCMLY